jgi:hypothetical protein
MVPGVRRDYDWIPDQVRNDMKKNQINFFTPSLPPQDGGDFGKKSPVDYRLLRN